MKVSELIEQLLKLDHDLEVRIPVDSFGEELTSEVYGVCISVYGKKDVEENNDIRIGNDKFVSLW